MSVSSVERPVSALRQRMLEDRVVVGRDFAHRARAAVCSHLRRLDWRAAQDVGRSSRFLSLRSRALALAPVV